MDELCNKWLRAVAEMDAGLMVGIAQCVQSLTQSQLQQMTNFATSFLIFEKNKV